MKPNRRTVFDYFQTRVRSGKDILLAGARWDYLFCASNDGASFGWPYQAVNRGRGSQASRSGALAFRKRILAADAVLF